MADELPSGNKYSKADVKSEFVHGYVYLFIFVHTEALQTYRKTLARAPKESEHDRCLKRSRQQKVTLCISSTYVYCSFLVTEV